MSVEALKEQARRHEQKEEWQKALDQYKKAIEKLAEDDQPDIGLYNRVGDLSVRVGNLDSAVIHYEQAVDLYVEAYLPNNAIAICKKVIRNLPDRHSIYLKMGQVRAQQGFLPDARTNFLTYAERMQQDGDLDESFRALVEFCDLAPDDVDVRLAVADQMASHERAEEAVEQLSIAYKALMARGSVDQAAEVKVKVLELDPNADLDRAEPVESVESEEMIVTGSSLADEPESDSHFGEISHGEEKEDEIAGAVEEAIEEEDDELPAMGFGDEDDEEAVELPMMDFSGEDDEEAVELPLMGFGDEDDEEAVELPMMSFDDEGGEERETVDLGPTVISGGSEQAREEAVEEAVSDRGAEDTLESVQAAIDANPDDVALRQRKVELAYLGGDEAQLVDAYVGLADALDRTGEGILAAGAYRQVLDLDPSNERAKAALGDRGTDTQPVKEVASQEDYVDLGALLLGDDDEKSTRMTVAYEEPSGDEAADFSKMLSQFKEKVSENIDANDVQARHDLGTAYKEMGLLDEAIAEFQQALRASADHLPTYELLGQTFLEIGQPDAAVRSLQRALELEFDVEDELLGIYYYLGRAYEDLGNRESAVEFYDRVFSMDINFADVTERLRALR